MLYFVQGDGDDRRAHVAKCGDPREMLLYQHYDTVCGARIRPYLWGVRNELGDARLCDDCARALGLSIVDEGNTP